MFKINTYLLLVALASASDSQKHGLTILSFGDNLMKILEEHWLEYMLVYVIQCPDLQIYLFSLFYSTQENYIWGEIYTKISRNTGAVYAHISSLISKFSFLINQATVGRVDM